MLALEDALLSAYKKTPEAAKYARVEMDRHTADFKVFELLIPPGEARFWIYRVARNMAINEFRKSNTRYRLFDRVVEAMSPRARNPEQEYEAQERQTLVLEMLQTLPEDQRAALLLREQEQLSYREIGQVLNVSESKVKVDIFRARASLRERWSKMSGLSRAAGISH